MRISLPLLKNKTLVPTDGTERSGNAKSDANNTKSTGKDANREMQFRFSLGLR